MSPSQKYEIWLQLVRQEVTVAEAAADHQVDRRCRVRRLRGWVINGAAEVLHHHPEEGAPVGVASRSDWPSLPSPDSNAPSRISPPERANSSTLAPEVDDSCHTIG